MSGPIGPMFPSHHLEGAVALTLQKWFPDYLKEAQTREGLPTDTLIVPENYTKRNSFDATPGEKLPKVVVLSPGVIGAPQKNGNQYRAVWSIGVGIAMAAATEELANTYDKIYGAVVREIILEQPGDVAGFSEAAIAECIWLEENYNDLAIPSQTQWYRSISVFFGFDIENVAQRYPGPTEPSHWPYQPFGQVQTVTVELVKDPIT